MFLLSLGQQYHSVAEDRDGNK